MVLSQFSSSKGVDGTPKTVQNKGSVAGIADCDPTERQQDEVTITVIQPAGRSDLKVNQVSIPLLRWTGGIGEGLPQLSGQSEPHVSSTPLERCSKETEQIKAATVESDKSVHSIQILPTNEDEEGAVTATVIGRKRGRLESGDNPSSSTSPSPARWEKRGRPAKFVAHIGQFTAAKLREKTLQKKVEVASEGAQ
jgi:hypothetical protein